MKYYLLFIMNTKRNIACGMYYPLDDDLEGSIDKLRSNLREMNFSDDLIVKTENVIPYYQLDLKKNHPEYVKWSMLMKQNFLVKQLINDGFETTDAYNIINCTPFVNLCCA